MTGSNPQRRLTSFVISTLVGGFSPSPNVWSVSRISTTSAS